ncbi:MAG: hypothetical protein ABFD89_18875, partial [Bryobacteraceae bacterium]
IAGALRRERFEITFLSAEEACDPAALSPKKYFLYVVPNVKSYPASGVDALGQYLRSNGNLMLLGATPFANLTLESQPLIETVSPVYKMYALKGIASLKVVPTQGILSGAQMKLPVPASALASYARPEGKGFERGYKWRWIPLVRALDKDGMERGTAAWIMLQDAPLSEGPAFADAVRRLVANDNARHPLGAEGSAYAVCAITDPAALRELALTSMFGDMARRIADGLFLSYGGSEQFSYWPDEKVRLGATVVNRGIGQAAVTVRIRVRAKGVKEAAFQKESTLIIKPGRSATAAFEWAAQGLSSECYLVTTELLRNGRPIDIISHGMGVLSTKKASRNAFVTVKDGDFWLEGKKWYPVGVNYWPSYAAALEHEDYAYHWLSPGIYNPEEVERDLKLLQSMGATFLGIRVNHQDNRRTILDFLRRCRNHGLRVFVFVQSHVISDDPHYFQGIMMPFHFQEELAADFIRETRLADNPALLAWDLIWEPAGWVFSDNQSSFGWKGDLNYRKRWDADWAKWIDDRYGNIANAEADWQVPTPRLNGRVTSPSSKQFREDGPWRVMVAAYRRFMDDLMSRKWNDTTRTLRRLDPNHLISYRQGNLSSTDFTLTATPKHVDFFAMEGHNFKASVPSATEAAGFTNRYIHFATKGLPYFWVEFTADVWNSATMLPDENKFAYQIQCHEIVYREGLENGAKGGAPWWLIGGYRVNEKNDQGIINPDGTLRPSGRLLQQYAALFKKSGTYPEADTWFDFDRDRHSGGLFHLVFDEGAKAYKEAAAQGHKLGIRTEATGTTSVNVPLVAVGNTKYSGHNPPKYLNAEFNWFRIKFAGANDWIELRDGDRIRVPRNKPIFAAVSVGNLQEATWLTPVNCQGKPGAVYLATPEGSELKLKQPIAKDTARFEDADFGESFLLTEGIATNTKIELQMTAEGRAWFGEKLTITFEPR